MAHQMLYFAMALGGCECRRCQSRAMFGYARSSPHCNAGNVAQAPIAIVVAMGETRRGCSP